MGEERRSSPSVCLHDFFAQKFDGVLFNARYIAPRLLQTMPGIIPGIDFWEHHRNSCIPCTQRKPASRTGASSFTIERVRWHGSWSRPDMSSAARPRTKRASSAATSISSGSGPTQRSCRRRGRLRLIRRRKTRRRENRPRPSRRRRSQRK